MRVDIFISIITNMIITIITIISIVTSMFIIITIISSFIIFAQAGHGRGEHFECAGFE